MIASLNQSSSLSSFGTALMSVTTSMARPSRQASEQQGRSPANVLSHIIGRIFRYDVSLSISIGSSLPVVSTCPHLPSQIAKSGPFANELNAEQHARQPHRRYRKAGPQIESYQYRNDSARQDPTPVRKGPYRQRKNHLRNALNQKVHEQQKREKARPSMTNQKHADYH